MDFNQAIPAVLLHEGGYVWHKDDIGGETKYGITKRSYPDLDIKNLTIEQAKDIYKRDYWNKNKIDLYPDAIRLMMFDMAVNMGNKNAVKVLQKSLIWFGMTLTIDGIAGKNTLAACKKIPANKMWLLCSMINGERIRYYFRLVEIRPANKSFIIGWVKRANAILIDTEQLL